MIAETTAGLSADDLRRARTYITRPDLCNVETSNEWISALLDEIGAYKHTVDTLADIIRAIREHTDAGVVDGILDEFGVSIEYDTH